MSAVARIIARLDYRKKTHRQENGEMAELSWKIADAAAEMGPPSNEHEIVTDGNQHELSG